MTPEEVQNLVKEIIAGIESGADLAATLAPQIVPMIVIGKAVDKVIPGLAGMVTRWIDGNPPTDAEVAVLTQKLSVLADPNNP